jgi:Fic/DOC family
MGRGRTFKYTLFPLPSLSQWIDRFGLFFEEIEANFRNSSLQQPIVEAHCLNDRLRPTRQVVDEALLPLWHDLSDEVLDRANDARYSSSRTASERDLLGRLYSNFCCALNSSDAGAFIQWVKDASTGLGTSTSGIRTANVFTRRNVDGDRFRYPPASMIEGRLEEIHRFIRHSCNKSPVFTATVAMVALTNCHPLPDGNGRTSRMLFNAILRLMTPMEAPYIPLYEIFWVSGFGYEIRVLAAVTTDEWLPLFEYVMDISRICLTKVVPASTCFGDSYAT